MQLVAYRFFYLFIWIFSRVPWPVFYFLSDCIYVLVYYLIGYRKKTVTQNLRLVFPDKSNKEIKRIRKASYKHMCDMFLEMTRTLSITKEEMSRRFHITNPEIFKDLEIKNKSIIAMMGHYNSYEWTNSIEMLTKFKCVGIYKPVKNKYINDLAKRIRARFGSRLIASPKAIREITRDQFKEGELNLYGLISDQSPKIQNATFWIDFMGIKVPAFVGGEILSRKLGLSTYYMHVEKVKRGFYEGTLIPLSEDPKNEEEPFIITKKFTKMLEAQIKNKPENYLWTHKRWKHRNETIPEDATVV